MAFLFNLTIRIFILVIVQYVVISNMFVAVYILIQSCSTFQPTLVIVCLFCFTHSGVYKIALHRDFNLYFHDGYDGKHQFIHFSAMWVFFLMKYLLNLFYY